MNINPIALEIGPLSIHWYGLSYGLGLTAAVLTAIYFNKKMKVFKGADQVLDFAFWVFILGVIFGGRIGYVLFYNLPYYLENPQEILAIWKGGMSFHGGLVGSVIVGYLFTKKYKISFWKMADLIGLVAPLATPFGRIANFINKELVGRPIQNNSWEWLGVDIGDGVLRYPSPLFQAFAEASIFIFLLLLYYKKPKTGVLFFGYVALYGLFRAIAEIWRAPDPQIGFIFENFTLGQLFSLSMLVIGCIGILKVYRKTP